MLRSKLFVMLALALPFGLISVAASPAQAVADRDCPDFASQYNAQIFFIKAGGPARDPHRLDVDHDGIACEDNPAPYYYGTTLPPRHLSSAVSLAFNHQGRIASESTTVTVKASPAAPRVVDIQRRDDNGVWRRWTRRTTSSTGVVSFAFAAPGATTSYRAVVFAKRVGNVIYDQRTSAQRTLNISDQGVTLTMPSAPVAQGQSAKAVVQATPVRKGRTVVVQRLVDGRWERYGKKGAENTSGRATFALPTADLGETQWRAVVAHSNGADAAASDTGVLSVTDQTPPAAPAEVTATAADGAVNLTWSAVADAAFYRIYRSTDGSTWTFVVDTAGLSLDDTGLTNGTAYQYAVAAIDAAGNQSPRAYSASVTPAAPVAQRSR